MKRDIFTAVLHLLLAIARGAQQMTTGMIMSNDGSELANQSNSGENSVETYESFISITKWAVIVVASLLIVLAIVFVH